MRELPFSTRYAPAQVVVLLLAALLAASCRVQTYVPQTPSPRHFLYADSVDASGALPDARWWKIFGDTTLDRLIEHALQNNRDVQQAASRVRQARFALDQARAQFLPQFGVSLSGQGDYKAQTGTVQEYAGPIQASWEIPLFGTLKATTEAGSALMYADEFAYRGVMLSLAAQVATTYFSMQQYRQSLSIAQRSYLLRRESTAIIDSMYRYGMSSEVDLQQARSLTATAAADIPQYRRAFGLASLSLDVLLGEAPTQVDFASATLPAEESMSQDPEQMMASSRSHLQDTTAALPRYVPAGLPSDILERRPDVAQAWWTVQSTAARVQLARAERFPTITLTGQGGVLSETLRGLTGANPFTWLASLGVTQPVFNFERLKRAEQEALESNRQAVLSYEQTMLAALSDVEQALLSIETYHEQAARYLTILEANRKIRIMTWQLYRSGMTDYLEVLDAERTYYSTQLEYAAILGSQLSAYVSLYKALGGGW